jgi:hypothetical protein
VTGNQELRSALVDLYRGGLYWKGCATTTNGSSVIVNFSCEIVRRHLCDGAARAVDIQRRTGHAELASQVSMLTREANCEALGLIGTP